MSELINIVTVVGVIVAIVQLNLQRLEFKRTGDIQSLLFLSQYLKEQIERKEKIIAELKSKKKEFKHLADNINNKLRPQLDNVHRELIQLAPSSNLFLTEEINALSK